MRYNDYQVQSLIPGGNKWFMLLVCLIGYSTLNRGFAYIGYYPFFVGELAMVISMLILNHERTLPRFLGTSAGKIWAVFFIYSLIIFTFSALDDVNESIRNSVFWVYTIFFYIGYSYGGRLIQRQELDRFQSFLAICSVASIVYFALFPIRDKFLETTMFLHGGKIALVGYYSTLHALSLGLVFFLLFYKQTKFYLLLVMFGMFMILAVSQSRAAILATSTMLLYLLFVHRRVSEYKVLIKLLTIVVIAGVIYTLSGITIEGSRGDVSIGFFKNAIESIFFSSNIDALEGSRADRLMWWEGIIERTASTDFSLFFGIGMDSILVNRATGPGTILRYPHNSFVSVFAFLGIIGFCLYVMIAGLVLRKLAKLARTDNVLPLLKWYPFFAIGYFVSAFFSTVFEAPFHSFVFWTITGVAYRAAYQTGLHRQTLS